MEIQDGIMIGAIIIGPLLAVQATRWIDGVNEKESRKLKIFKTLMATRGYITSQPHVEALNMIDLDFSTGKKKDKAVIDAWQAYLNSLDSKQSQTDAQYTKQRGLFIKLLHTMSQAVGYDFNETEIENRAYAPIEHSNIENDIASIRKNAASILRGEKLLRVGVSKDPEDLPF